LDLTEANIVSGGEYYYMPTSGTKYYTENNVAGDYMFYFCNLKTIKFPSTITKLGNYVCAHLPKAQGNENVEDGNIGTFTSIIIPEGVTKIDNYAFAWNQNLSSIELPNTLKEMGYLIFYRCDAITTLNIPNSVEKDNGYTFMWCSGLQFVHISENPKYTTIGWWSFLGCKSLTTLTIPANITKNLWRIGQNPHDFFQEEFDKQINRYNGFSWDTSGGAISIVIGDINLSGVQDVNGLSKAIVSRLPSQIIRDLYK
jgi:hypothetical protein